MSDDDTRGSSTPDWPSASSCCRPQRLRKTLEAVRAIANPIVTDRFTLLVLVYTSTRSSWAAPSAYFVANAAIFAIATRFPSLDDAAVVSAIALIPPAF